MPAIPVVLDVDTGVDDACALLLAALHPGLDLRAVTCVGGNAPLADVVRNTLSVLDTCTETTGWATSTGRGRRARSTGGTPWSCSATCSWRRLSARTRSHWCR